jgi:signal transduction histidine kinase
VVLSAEARPASVRVIVRDTGLGIPADRLATIFAAFTQAVDTPETFDGTGLGLALVKRIVEAHDSRVEVESQPNLGSTFSFELPLASLPAAA